MKRRWHRTYCGFTVVASIETGYYLVYKVGVRLPIATVRRQDTDAWKLWQRRSTIFQEQRGSYRTLRDAAKFANDEWEAS